MEQRETQWKTDDCGSEWVIFFQSRPSAGSEVECNGWVAVRRHNSSLGFHVALSNIWKCFCFCSENFRVGKELKYTRRQTWRSDIPDSPLSCSFK